MVKAAYEDKKGTENIFERYISSSQDGVDVYDFRKIGEQNRYGMKRLDGSAELKVSRFWDGTIPCRCSEASAI